MFSGCSVDAERDNPLDPKGDIYNPPASISGKVTRLNTEDPIPGVVLFLSPGSFASYTDESGNYSIAADIAQVFDLLITHPQYKDIETQVELFRNSPVSADYKMDALTKIDSVLVTSQRIGIDDFGDTFEYLVNVEVEISDADGSSDLDSSTVECSFLEQLIEMENGGGSEFILSISDEMFPGGDIENMIGVEFEIRLIDKSGDTLTEPPREINAIFDFSLDPIEPGSNGVYGVVDNGNPTFDWTVTDYRIILDHYFRIEVFRDNGQLRYERQLWEGVENFTVNAPLNHYYFDFLDDTLDIGTYYWTIQLENAFGDFTRSAKILFDVQ